MVSVIRALLLFVVLVLAFPVWAEQLTALEAFDKGQYARAARLLQPMVDRGITEAQLRLGWLYSEGKGVAKDENAAIKLYSAAAEQRHPEAEFNVGNFYHHGKGGVPKDDKKAAMWFLRSAKRGYIDSQFNLGRMLFLGEGVGRDRKQGLMWLDRSARQGDTYALAFLANQHVKNFIPNASLKMAWMYFDLAARWGDELSARAQGLLVTPKLSEADIEEARKMQQAWLKETGLKPPPPRK